MPSAAPFVHPIAAPPQVLRAHDPFDMADGAAPARRIDPHDSLFRGITPVEHWQGPSQADNVDAANQAFAAPKALLPTDLDDLDIDALLGDTPPGQQAPIPAHHPASARAPAAFAPPAAAPAAFASPAAAPAAFAPARPAPAAPTGFPAQPAVYEDGPVQATAPQSGPFDFEAEPPPHVPPRPSPQSASAPAGAPAAVPVTPPASAAPPPSAPGPDAARLLAAFLEGAGVPIWRSAPIRNAQCARRVPCSTRWWRGSARC